MDLKTIGLTALAGFGAYCAYERFLAPKDKTSSFRGTGWQQGGLSGTPWQQYNEFKGTGWQQGGLQGTGWQQYNEFTGTGRRMKNMAGMPGYSKFTGTNWQNVGRDRGTKWQRKGVFSNMAGGVRPGARRTNLQGTDWQTANMSNACGSCGA